MLINKITTGFVLQTYDTDKKEFVSQNFTAGDVAYESQDLDLYNEATCRKAMQESNNGVEPYLLFDMVQPKDYEKIEKIHKLLDILENVT